MDECIFFDDKDINTIFFLIIAYFLVFYMYNCSKLILITPYENYFKYSVNLH